VKKQRMEILVIGLVVLALSAGVVAGLVAARLPGSSVSPGDGKAQPPLPPGPMEQSLAEQLQLSPDQREQMKGIWEGVRSKVHRAFEDAEKLQVQRDEALVAILDEKQKEQFSKISKEFADKYNALSDQRDAAFADAVEKTKKLLNETQRTRYEEILRAHRLPGPPPPGSRRVPGAKTVIAAPPPGDAPPATGPGR